MKDVSSFSHTPYLKLACPQAIIKIKHKGEENRRLTIAHAGCLPEALSLTSLARHTLLMLDRRSQSPSGTNFFTGINLVIIFL